MSSGRATAPGTSIGVDIGGTKVLGVVLGPRGSVLHEARRPTPQSGYGDAGGAPAVVEAVVEVVAELDRRTEATPAAVGIGVPGMVDRRGWLRVAPNLPAASGADLRSMVGAALPGRAVRIENDANCAVVAEHRLGAAQDASDVLLVTLGTGIGGGIVSAGALLGGAEGFAGEVGHMVIDPEGPPCPCGRRGCWERYASGSGLGRLARDAAIAGHLSEVVHAVGGDPERVRGEDVSAAAARGDAAALAVFEELGYWVAVGLANLVAILDPSCVVIGGGLGEAGEILLVPTRRAFHGAVEGGSERPAIAIRAAWFGDRAGAVGAALLAGRSEDAGSRSG